MAALVVDNGSGMFMAGFARFGVSHAVLLSFVGNPAMPGIMVGMLSVVDAPVRHRQVPAVLGKQTVQNIAYFLQVQVLDVPAEVY